MTIPELDTLPQRMRYAATILEETNQRYRYGLGGTWYPGELRKEADIIETEDTETAELEALVEELAHLIPEIPWNEVTDLHQRFYRDSAHRIIENGWRKDG